MLSTATPASPVISTPPSIVAARRTSSFTRMIVGDSPTSSTDPATSDRAPVIAWSASAINVSGISELALNPRWVQLRPVTYRSRVGSATEATQMTDKTRLIMTVRTSCVNSDTCYGRPRYRHLSIDYRIRRAVSVWIGGLYLLRNEEYDRQCEDGGPADIVDDAPLDPGGVGGFAEGKAFESGE